MYPVYGHRRRRIVKKLFKDKRDTEKNKIKLHKPSSFHKTDFSPSENR